VDKQLEAEVEELEFHQETVATPSNSPLQLIREKELEISGRVLAAKREADAILSDARRKAAEMLAQAEHEVGSSDREAVVMEAAARDVESVKENARGETDRLAESIARRSEDAIAFVVDALTRV